MNTFWIKSLESIKNDEKACFRCLILFFKYLYRFIQPQHMVVAQALCPEIVFALMKLL